MHTASQIRISLVSPVPWWVLTLIQSLTPQPWLVSPTVGIQVGEGKGFINYKYCQSLLCEFNFWDLSFTPLPHGRWAALVEIIDSTLSPQYCHGVTYSQINPTGHCHSLFISQKSILHTKPVYTVLGKYSIAAVEHAMGDFPISLNLAISYKSIEFGFYTWYFKYPKTYVSQIFNCNFSTITKTVLKCYSFSNNNDA